MKTATRTAQRVLMNGDEAVALAVKQSNIDVVSSYPITPQTIIVERLAGYAANGEIQAEYVCAESEHSALSACLGASLAGARVFTATSSQGLALMHEVLYAVSGLRCPVVMAVVNRALSAPINIHNDHSDMMGSRDSGWIQVYAENVQEAYDWSIMAFRLAEHPSIELPVAVNLDGFTISHSAEDLEVLEDEDVEGFVGNRVASHPVAPDRPMTYGAFVLPNFYYEFKRQQEEAMRKAREALPEITAKFHELSGRRYAPIEEFKTNDAEVTLICLGSVAGTAKHVASELRGQGEKVGVVKVSTYRPFPTEELVNAVRRAKAIVVIDRAISFGAPFGPLCSDVRALLQGKRDDSVVLNAICGLGGRDVTEEDLRDMFLEATRAARGERHASVAFVGVK